MVAWTATFPAASGIIGNTDEGLPIVPVRGSVFIRDGRGYAQPTTPGPFAVVEGGSGASDGELTASFPPAGAAGQALAFRVVDVNNYWRLSYRVVIDSSRGLWVDRVVNGARSFYTLPMTATDLPSMLRVRFQRSNIECAAVTPNGERLLNLNDSIHQSATRHGFGYDEGNNDAGYVGVDRVAYRLPEGQSSGYTLGMIL